MNSVYSRDVLPAGSVPNTGLSDIPFDSIFGPLRGKYLAFRSLKPLGGIDDHTKHGEEVCKTTVIRGCNRSASWLCCCRFRTSCARQYRAMIVLDRVSGLRLGLNHVAQASYVGSATEWSNALHFESPARG